MQKSIVRGFANLLRFSGRDTRAEFWPYAGAALALYMVVGMAVSLPIMLPLFLAFGRADIAATQATVSRFFIASFSMGAVLIALLAAAVARRLHDSGRTAAWGLAPMPFLVFSGVMFVRLFSQFVTGAPDLRIFFAILASNLLYLASIAWLGVLLMRGSSPGRNRFG